MAQPHTAHSAPPTALAPRGTCSVAFFFLLSPFNLLNIKLAQKSAFYIKISSQRQQNVFRGSCAGQLCWCDSRGCTSAEHTVICSRQHWGMFGTRSQDEDLHVPILFKSSRHTSESLKRGYCKWHGVLYFNMINIMRHTKINESKDLREISWGSKARKMQPTPSENTGQQRLQFKGSNGRILSTWWGEQWHFYWGWKTEVFADLCQQLNFQAYL